MLPTGTIGATRANMEKAMAMGIITVGLEPRRMRWFLWM
jgi:hypothetical protein